MLKTAAGHDAAQSPPAVSSARAYARTIPFAFRSRSLTFETMELLLEFKDGVSFQNGALPLFLRRPETGGG